MESLSEQQQEAIRKMGDDRLRQNLIRAGLPTAAVNVLDRQALLSAWAELVASGRDKPTPSAAAQPMFDPELEKRRLEFEERKWAEKLQIEKEKLRLQMETYDSPASIFKRYGDALRGTLSRMPSDAADLPAFFENAERLFADIKAPETIRAQLLTPYLSDKARVLVSKMDQTRASSYKEVKTMILREYKMTPLAYFNKYQTATKQADETYVMFVNRLKTLLGYYVASRNVSTFQKLISLLVADHAKSMLSGDCLNHVLTVENTLDDGWLTHDKLAETVDAYIANHKPQVSNSSNAATVSNTVTKNVYQQKQYRGFANQPENAKSVIVKQERRCFHCDSRMHLFKHCPHRDKTSVPVQGTAEQTFRKSQTTSQQSARVHTTLTETADHTQAPSTSLHSDNQYCTRPAETLHVTWHPDADSEFVSMPNVVNDSIASLSYIDVCIDGIDGTVHALHDSGAQISVVHSNVVSTLDLPCEGTIKLRGLFGDAVDADLVSLFVKLPNGKSIPVLMAMSSKVNNDLILTDPVVKSLFATEERICVTSCDTNVDHTSDSDESVLSDTEIKPDDLQSDENPVTNKPSTQELIEEQKSDETLAQCWSLANKQKGGYYVKDGLLYHLGKIAGQFCEQLCVPIKRRPQVLSLAHEVYGAHMGKDKTCDRIRLSFYWPTLVSDCKRHCMTCEQCQKRARSTVFDRVPISPIPRADEPFVHLFMDCFGPLFPNKKVKYNYCLLLVDSATRWPSAFPLHSLTSKSVCDALLKQFAETGIPERISSDNASNFTSSLTREFLKVLGCSPQFSTPAHPQACGLVERLVGSVKSAISKVAADHPKQWYTHLPCILWALRESPHSTTGVPPWLLAFGRLPRGPLSVLKDTWTGAEDPPLNLGKSVTDYLKDLRERFAIAEQYASEHADVKQTQYAHHYNLRSREKQFDINEQVLVLTPDSTASKTFSKWRGPGIIVSKKSPHSYLVEIDNTRIHVHANKLRKFHHRVQEVTCEVPVYTAVSCDTAVIYEKDTDFGDIVVPEPKPFSADLRLPSEKIDDAKLNHLQSWQKEELLTLLDKYSDCFSDTPGFCSLVEHEIPILNSFVPKRLAPYKIPVNLRNEVEQQIQELLSLGIIRPSKSPMASPVVCVLKGRDGKGGVRLAVDYRYVNKHTVPDSYPLPDISDLIQTVGNASLISTFDTTKGYYQTPVKEEHCWLTAFVCEFGLFEFTRTPFGMRSSGGTFVRSLQQILKPVQKFTASYVDDMSVYSMAWKEHMKHLEKFLHEIKMSGFTLNLKKCTFALPEVKFVGHIIGSGQRRADSTKIKTMLDMITPTDKKQVRQILGFFSYFRDYIPNFSHIAEPLSNLTRKGKPDKVLWGQTEQTAFDQMKASLAHAASTPLAVMDFSKPYNVYVDASDYAAACVITQDIGDQVDRPVAFASVKLSPTQRNWSTVEKEAFASIWALKKYHRWLFRSKITVYSDHNPLTFLTQASSQSSKLMRWALALQEFDVSFKFKEGRHNTAADCLSRVGPHLPQPAE